MAYYDKNLTPQQAAELYNGNPRVNGSELAKGVNNKVKYNNVEYDPNKTDEIIAAKKAKIDADDAANLANAKTKAISHIQALMDDTSAGKTELTDAEIKEQLNKTENNVIDGTTIKDWKDYINKATTTTEVDNRKNKVESAITEVRKTKQPPFDAAAARTQAIGEVKNYWKTKSSDQTENGTINGKKITEVLGADWEKEFDDKNEQSAIDSKKNELTDKIDTEKAKEPEKEEEKLTDKKVEQVIQTVLGDTTIKPQSEVVKFWQYYNNTNSKLKTAEQIQKFLTENVENKKTDFAKFLEEIPDTDKPTGNDDREKVNNFLANQKAEVVIKTVFKYKLKDETYQGEIETEMENEKDEEKVLDTDAYPKQDGKYTKEAMVRYLYEKETGQVHQFSAKGEKTSTPTNNESHWDKYKYWYIGGGIIITLAIVVVGIFWNKPTDSTEEGTK